MSVFEFPRPRTVLALSSISFRELVREKVLYNGALAALVLLFLMFFISQLSIENPARIVVSLGLVIVRLSMASISMLLGAALVPKEFARGTALIVLARPVNRTEMVLGLYTGLIGVTFVNWLVLSAALLSVFAMVGGEINGLTALALSVSFIEGLILGAVAILFSAFASPAMSVTMSIGLLLVGSNVSQLRYLETRAEAPLSWILGAAARAVPNLERFQLAENIIYSIPVTWTYVAGILLYAAVWSALLIAGAGLILSRRRA